MLAIRRDSNALVIVDNADSASARLDRTWIYRSSKNDPDTTSCHVKFTQLSTVHVLETCSGKSQTVCISTVHQVANK